jgi:amino acid adenylation domain-containing protein
MVLTGEKLLPKAAFKWADKLDFAYNWYGPAEASVATSYRIDRVSWKAGISGKSVAGFGRAWLVDPKNAHFLAPIGAVAELCMEGPMVATYTGSNSESLNQQAFFSPQWPQFVVNGTGARSRRLYKTGDLVRYDDYGNIIFLGRKHDSQRKLRGQRVDLGEIEGYVQACLSGTFEASTVAEIFIPANGTSETLALFISPLSSSKTEGNVVTIVKQGLPVERLEDELLQRLPSYMVPKIYIPIEAIPVSQTGKADRQRLRQFGSSLTQEQLAEMQPSRQESMKPSTKSELQLQQLWADIIGIDIQSISANDNFLRLGDSIDAMRLVALARKRNLLLTVTDVFEAPRLKEMAKRIKQDVDSCDQEVPAFSLLGWTYSKDEACSYAAKLCSVSKTEIVDMYPCTALQEGLLALGVRQHGQYVSRSVLELQTGIDTDRLERAWLNTTQKIALLRTRIVDLPGQGYVQVVLDDFHMRSGSDVEAYVRQDEQEAMGPGAELCRAAIIDRRFILTIHHCTYDGNTLKMMLDELEAQYLGEPGMNVTPFRNFIQHLSNITPQSTAKFWKGQFVKLEARQFPVLPTEGYRPQANDELGYSISLNWPRTGTTPSTIIRSSWAILATQYTQSSDVIFAVTVNGRQASMKGVENCVGPTISTFPLAISVDWSNSVDTFLACSQKQIIDTIPYEQYGLQNIQRPKGNLDPRLIQTLLVVQPVAQGKSFDDDSLLFKARSFSANLDTMGTDPFNNYALMVICELAPSGLHVRLSFDDNIIDKTQISRMARQFETVIRQLCAEDMSSVTLDSVQTTSKDDLDLLWAQNAILQPDPVDLVHDLITKAARERPDFVAIDAWDGQFTYREVDELSTKISLNLVSHGVTPGSIVALHFEKSRWVPVVQVAVFKAGCADVMLSISVPDLRISRVFANLNVMFAIATESRAEMVSEFASCFTVAQLLQELPADRAVSLPQVHMRDPAAILVSSGSTGEPKQVLWSHSTMAANVKAHGEFLGVTPDSRIFQFASYDFDVGTIESMSALVHQCCLCIPSEFERLDRTTSVINRYSITFMNITPSTAKAIRPQDVPSVKILVLSGEILVKDDVDRWKGHCHVINWYGAAEHPSTAIATNTDTWRTATIGSIDSKQPTHTWLVDLRNHNRLTPLGAVGEIAQEGPLSSEGYLANPALNERRFKKDPIFLLTGHGPDCPGRSNRIYCTGDLGRYDSLGNLVYMGRKDAQLKIRGQLVAPEEVEHHLRRSLAIDRDIPVVVDAIKSQYGKNVTLVAFLNVATEAEVDELTMGVNEKLKRVLPPYAIPVYYIPVEVFPTNASAKTDRKRLREIGASFDPTGQTTTSKRRDPSNAAERTLRELWSRALGVESTTISVNDSFLHVGDSVAGMRLVGIARQQGLYLTVASIFEHPVLEDMAKVLRNREDEDDEEAIPPFSLLGLQDDIDLTCQQAATLCSAHKDDIEDLYPCTPLQEGLLALTVKRQGDYTGRTILRLAPSADIARFKKALEEVIASFAIMRTRIINLPGHGLVQAIVRGPGLWIDASSIDDYIDKDSKLPMDLGLSLMRCGIFSEMDAVYFALTLHHSIYDGLTTPLILEALVSRYNSETPLRNSPFQNFVKYLASRDKQAEVKFWSDQFEDIQAPQYPVLPSSTYQPQTNSTLMHLIENITWRADNITPSTVIRAVTALVCSQHSNSSDVVIGVVSSGRQAPVGGIETLGGPTIATVPMRVKFDDHASSLQLLEALQSQATRMIPYEQIGLSSLRQISDEALQACQFQTHLVVQMDEENLLDSMENNNLFVSEARRSESEDEARRHGFQSYALSIICTPRDNGLGLRFCFDSAVIQQEAVHRISLDFEQLLRKFCSTDLDDAPLDSISLINDHELNQIWQWNKSADAASWIIDPESDDRLSPIGRIGELCLERFVNGHTHLRDQATEDAFIENPSWLLNGSADGTVSGRSGRVYKTGNLVKYDVATGSIVTVGNKDTLIKLHGQTIDLEEVEKQATLSLGSGIGSVGAAVVTPKTTGKPTLIAFVQFSSTEVTDKIHDFDSLEYELREHLPLFMIPSAYIVVESLPLLANGTPDRHALADIGAHLKSEQLSGSKSQTDVNLPTTEAELRLCKIWTDILGVPTEKIRTNTSFLRLGGDSVSAMRMASLARSHDILLTVQCILQTPRLSDMAKAMINIVSSSAASDHVPPFALLKVPTSKDAAIDYVARQLNVASSQIEDIFPSTSVQKSLLSMTAKSSQSYVARYSLRLRDHINIAYLKQAWEEVSKRVAPILRYRVLDVPNEGLVQVQLKEELEWDTCESIKVHVERDRKRTMGLGTRLTRLAIVHDEETESLYCAITQHHAIYDGYSVGLILTEVSKAYAGVVDNSPIASFQSYMRHVTTLDRDDAKEFWGSQFADSEAVPFPALPHEDYQPKADSTVHHHIENFKWPKEDATASTSKLVYFYHPAISRWCNIVRLS